jgi:hypothetical protein
MMIPSSRPVHSEGFGCHFSFREAMACPKKETIDNLDAAHSTVTVWSSIGITLDPSGKSLKDPNAGADNNPGESR